MKRIARPTALVVPLAMWLTSCSGDQIAQCVVSEEELHITLMRDFGGGAGGWDDVYVQLYSDGWTSTIPVRSDSHNGRLIIDDTVQAVLIDTVPTHETRKSDVRIEGRRYDVAPLTEEPPVGSRIFTWAPAGWNLAQCSLGELE